MLTIEARSVFWEVGPEAEGEWPSPASASDGVCAGRSYRAHVRPVEALGTTGAPMAMPPSKNCTVPVNAGAPEWGLTTAV